MIQQSVGIGLVFGAGVGIIIGLILNLNIGFTIIIGAGSSLLIRFCNKNVISVDLLISRRIRSVFTWGWVA